MAYRSSTIDTPFRSTRQAGPDMNARAARESEGYIYLVWQGVHGKYSQIYLMHIFPGGHWSEPVLISPAEPTGEG